MKAFLIAGPLLILAAVASRAATLYVSLNCTNPVSPYADWSTAATKIQDAVDVSTNGDQICVTNGIYRTGGRIVFNILSNRLVVNKAITVQSVNGPEVTVIEGFQPDSMSTECAIRCVYMTNGATLVGFTLTNGATLTNWSSVNEYGGGGVCCESANEIVSNCFLVGNKAYSSGGGAQRGSLFHCVLSGNSATMEGGGAGGSILNRCTITNNRAGNNGGGTMGSILTNCVLAGNVAWKWGGGAGFGQLSHCILTNNQATSGGGSWFSTLVNCALAGNVATDPNYGGGGAWNGQIYGCVLTGNSAPYGGGAGYASLFNCTIVSNSASSNGGGTYGCSAYNSIIYYNTAPTNADASSTSPEFSCLNPLPAGIRNFNNITNAPLFVGPDNSDYRLLPVSPCINAGSNGFVNSTVDLNGNARIVDAVVDIGAYEFQGNIRYVSLNSTNPISPYSDWSIAATNIQDAIDASTAGDLVLITNGVYQAGGRVVYGALTNLVVVDKAVTVQSVNGPAVTLIQGTGVPSSDSAARCVYLTNGAAFAGFTIANGCTRAVSWPTPTPENCGGGVWCESAGVMISNCVLAGNSAYFNGGGVYRGTLVDCILTSNLASLGAGAALSALTNCTLVANIGGGAYQSTLDACTIERNTSGSGGGGVLECTLTRCVLSNNSSQAGGGSWNSTLSDCSLSGNTALAYGGGAAFGTLVNCTLTGNSVNMTNSGCGPVSGGGAYGATLNNCVISANQVSGNSSTYGGGVSGGVLNNCLLSGNSCWTGGSGAYEATLNNCTVVNNSDHQPLFGGGAYNCTVNNSILRYNGVNYAGSSLNYCCTTPLPGGTGNIAADPLFVNRAGGDYHLQPNSPCINSGNNAFANNNLDLGANPRIVGGTADIGAYEYQTPVSRISYAWLQQYGLSITTNTDAADPDNDCMNNYQEWIAGTDPTNILSLLEMSNPAPTNNPAGLILSWKSVNNRTYFLQSSTNLAAQPAFSTIQSNIVGQPGMTIYVDNNAIGPGPYFYRVGVQQ